MPKLFQIVIPEEHLNHLLSVLEGSDIPFENIYRLYVGNAFMLMVPCPDSQLYTLACRLSDTGYGRNIGKVYVVPVDSVLPVLTGSPSAESGRKLRITNETLFESVDGGSGVSFDYFAMMIVAALISAGGLAGNSSVVVVASMLVSPLMGPILGICLACCMFVSFLLPGQNSFLASSKKTYNDLIWKAVGAEIIGILLCILVGIIVGLMLVPYGPFFEFPTAEMRSRGLPYNLGLGVLIAAPSGAGVALAVSRIDGGINSLVGVAISASLLPPLVNSGMLWAYGLVGPYTHPELGIDAIEYAIYGSISFALVLVNIGVIIVVAVIFFKLRGVMPHVAAVKGVETKEFLKDNDESASWETLAHDFTNPGEKE